MRVWFWRKNRITIHAFDDEGREYTEPEHSRALSGIDLAELVGFIDRPAANQAMREYRTALGARSAR